MRSPLGKPGSALNLMSLEKQSCLISAPAGKEGHFDHLISEFCDSGAVGTVLSVMLPSWEYINPTRVSLQYRPHVWSFLPSCFGQEKRCVELGCVPFSFFSLFAPAQTTGPRSWASGKIPCHARAVLLMV